MARLSRLETRAEEFSLRASLSALKSMEAYRKRCGLRELTHFMGNPRPASLVHSARPQLVC